MSDQTNPLDQWFKTSGLADLFDAAKTTPSLREAVGKARDLVEAPAVPVEARIDIHIAGGDGPIPARVYVPYGADPAPAPGLIFYHGGGFTIGSLDTYDPLCQRLAAVSGVRICSVGYRLAPEHPYPAAVDDAIASFDAALGGALTSYGFDRTRLAVGGDSAGGNLAATLARERRDSVIFQLLLYPVLQLVQVKKDRPRWQEGPMLSTATLEEVKKRYLKGADPTDPRISPLMAGDLKGLPPAWMLAAEFDPLLEEGEAYASKLAAFGVPVERKVYATAPHGFLNLSRIMPVCITALEDAAKALAKGVTRLAPSTPA